MWSYFPRGLPQCACSKAYTVIGLCVSVSSCLLPRFHVGAGKLLKYGHTANLQASEF